jgi:flagellar basal body-associated protein FliL
MDTIENTTGEEQTGKRKIILILLTLAALGIGIYYFVMRNNTDLDKQMERVRQAKADKKILTNVQNDN